MTRKFRLHIAYEGTNFHGWQAQEEAQEKRLPSISALLQQAVRQATTEENFILHGSGRTDVGVHAREQTAHLEVNTRLEPDILVRALNSYLPTEIRVYIAEEVPAEFHAQRHVREKSYRYFILCKTGKQTVSWPFLERWTWYLPQCLDTQAMQKGLHELVGKHDFAAFRNVGTDVNHTVREIFSADLIDHNLDPSADLPLPWMPPHAAGLKLLEIRVRGKGFLKQMVRNIVGTIVEVGRGKMTVANVREILASKDRAQSGPTAPPQGLFLNDICY